MNLSVIDQVIVVLYLAVIMSIGFAMKRLCRKRHVIVFPRRPSTALVGTGDVGIVRFFRHHGHDVDRLDLSGSLGSKECRVHWLWGFPITAFYLAYMGKWIRRSDAMTGAEWMKTRFGTGKFGDLARFSYTLFAILTITALLGYERDTEWANLVRSFSPFPALGIFDRKAALSRSHQRTFVPF